MVVANDDVDAERSCVFYLVDGGNPAIDGDEKSGSSFFCMVDAGS